MKISDFNLLNTLSAREQAKIEKIVRNLKFERGETIIAKGTKIQVVYLIGKGRVKESTCTRAGKEIVFNIFSESECFGLLSALNADFAKSDFVAIRDCDVGAVRVSDLREMMKAMPSLAQSVLSEFGRVASNFSDRLYEIRAMDVSERTRAELLRYASRNNVAAESPFFELINLPTHEELANSIFTHREAVTREISSLRRNGVIIKTGRNGLAANVNQLQQMITEYS
jgi:CRP/FNR family cyclic AMP-dependent transcriptional regulator